MNQILCSKGAKCKLKSIREWPEGVQKQALYVRKQDKISKTRSQPNNRIYQERLNFRTRAFENVALHHCYLLSEHL